MNVNVRMPCDSVFGVCRILSAIVGWVKIYLQTEQKKTDFKPEADLDTMASPVLLPLVFNLYYVEVISVLIVCLYIL